MPRKAPEKLQTHCLGHHKPYQREKGQARPSTAGHVGSSSLRSSPRGPTGLTLHSEGGTAVLLSLAWPQGEPRSGQPLWLYPGPKTDPGHKRCMLTSMHWCWDTSLPCPRAASAPQGIQLSQRKPWGCWSQPDLCAWSRKLVAGTGSHRNSLLPAKPRLSPAEASPSQGRSDWAHPPHSSEPCAGPPGQEQGQRCREESPLHAASSGRAAGAAVMQTPVAQRIR